MNNNNFPNAGARLDRLPTSRWHTQMWFVTAFALLVCWSNGIGGLVGARLIEIGWITQEGLASFSSLYTAGMLFGALIGGIIGDKIGRKKSILLYEIIHILAMIGAIVCPNMELLYIIRTIQGFGLGALLVVLFAGFTEYMPAVSRGTWSSRTSFIGNWAHPISSLIATLIVTIGVAPELDWRIQFAIPSVLSIIAMVLISNKFPESPRWLEVQGRYSEANEILNSIEERIEAQTGKKLPEVKISNEGGLSSISYGELFKGELLKRVIIGSLVLIGMNVIQYTLMNWLPTIFAAKGINTKDSTLLNTVGLFGAPFGIFIASLIMDKLPRKVMGIGLLVIIGVLGIFYGQLDSLTSISIVGFILFTFIYMYVCFASAVYVPEIWPTDAKLRGSGFCNAVGRASGIIFPFIVNIVLTNYGPSAVFVLLAVVAIIIAVGIIFLGVETRGESVEDIGRH
ncbi:MFS transporter [Anaerococcus sp. AGMB00486]|uniref:MFS transporter n=1 Tax=Anaerococcus faecalis TaxID=2742993 RepID=A0ABX2N8U6_9FIRM|nr:MFS transporter [Anaerococcus faecalis]NVF11122.1 MFS transporter [Anaerococcus faecalis]